MHKFILRCFALCLLSSPLVQATPININLDLKAFAFTPSYPQGVVYGTFGLQVDNVTGTILGINSVSMEISGHHYSVPELTYGMNGYGDNYITGLVSGANFLLAQTNDFYFSWAGSTAKSFTYTTANSFGAYQAYNFDRLNITAGAPIENQPPTTGNSVPEGGTTASLLACTVLSLAWASRRALAHNQACRA